MIFNTLIYVSDKNHDISAIVLRIPRATSKLNHVGFFSASYLSRTKSSTYAGVRLAGSRHKNVLSAELLHMARIPFFSLSSATFSVSRLKLS